MDCPVCKNAMITLELADVEIDFCIDCSGIWLDAGELELLLDDPTQAEKIINSFKIDHNCTEKPKKCPICWKKMQKIVVGLSSPRLLLDKCPRGDGIWFDKGELHEVLETASFDEGNKVIKLLTDMFSQQNNT